MSKPLISGLKPYYRIGDLLMGNCTSYYSKPAANLTWLVNGNEVSPKQTVLYTIVRDPDNGLETSILGLFFQVTNYYVGRSKLKFTCVARIYNVYEQRTERTLEDERPNMLAASASASPVGLNVNSHHIHSLYEQFPASSYHHLDTGGGGGDFDNQNSDAYMTQLQDMSSAASDSFSRTSWPLTRHQLVLLVPTLLLLPLLLLPASVIMQMASPVLLLVSCSMARQSISRAATVAATTSSIILGGLEPSQLSTFAESFS